MKGGVADTPWVAKPVGMVAAGRRPVMGFTGAGAACLAEGSFAVLDTTKLMACSTLRSCPVMVSRRTCLSCCCDP